MILGTKYTGTGELRWECYDDGDDKTENRDRRVGNDMTSESRPWEEAITGVDVPSGSHGSRLRHTAQHARTRSIRVEKQNDISKDITISKR